MDSPSLTSFVATKCFLEHLPHQLKLGTITNNLYFNTHKRIIAEKDDYCNIGSESDDSSDEDSELDDFSDEESELNELNDFSDEECELDDADQDKNKLTKLSSQIELSKDCASMINSNIQDERNITYLNEPYYHNVYIEKCLITNKDILYDNKVIPKNSKQLIKLCIESPFGNLKEQTTEINKDVRNAYEIPGTDLTLSESLQQKILKLEKDISKRLYNNRKINLEINKLNVYPKGGHFKIHTDTPIENNVGTLTIILNNYDYSGGDLIINGHRESYCNVIAFYSSVPHSISKVKSGCRVSLTFYIKYYKNENDEIIENIPPYVQKIYTKILNNNFCKFGVVLSHKYSFSEGENNVYKGADDYIIEKIKENFNLIVVFPVVVNTLAEYNYYHEEDSDVKIGVYRFTKDDLAKVAGGRQDFENNEYKNIPFYDFKFNGLLLRNNTQKCIEHTGNESQPGLYNNQYFTHVAIFNKNLK